MAQVLFPGKDGTGKSPRRHGPIEMFDVICRAFFQAKDDGQSVPRLCLDSHWAMVHCLSHGAEALVISYTLLKSIICIMVRQLKNGPLMVCQIYRSGAVFGSFCKFYKQSLRMFMPTSLPLRSFHHSSSLWFFEDKSTWILRFTKMGVPQSHPKSHDFSIETTELFWGSPGLKKPL